MTEVRVDAGPPSADELDELLAIEAAAIDGRLQMRRVIRPDGKPTAVICIIQWEDEHSQTVRPIAELLPKEPA